MSGIMTPAPLRKLIDWILEGDKEDTVFGIKRPFIADPDKTYEILGRKLETLFGSATGLHTQLTQNIMTPYVVGSRFSELKTIQKPDGEDLPVSKPCTKTDDECYNCGWSTEFYVPQAFDEYIKAWFTCKVLAREFGLDGPGGFQFNMSVGHDLNGIKTEKIGRLTEGMKDASETATFKECRQWPLDNLGRFEKVSREDIEAISLKVYSCTTLSTLHGCPLQEIERIVRHLTEEKRAHTFIKRNPTLLRHEHAGKIMDDMGYDYTAFDDFHFKDGLQYSDAVLMPQRLRALTDGKGLELGMKIISAFPADVRRNELPSEETYMSRKSLYPLSMSAAGKLTKDFGGKLRISYSDGADFLSIVDIMDVGIWPVAMATTILKPGGYKRLEQIGWLFAVEEAAAFEGVDAARVTGLVEVAKSDKHHIKAIKPLPSRKINRPVPFTDCFITPCREGCPIHQDITRYLQLVGAGELKQVLEAVLNKNPLSFITDAVYAHNCMSRCARDFYGSPVDIRRTKLEVAGGGFEAAMAKLKASKVSSGKKVTMVDDGPAGLAAAYLLARGGVKVTPFEKGEKMGGTIRSVVPEFRISGSTIDNDVKLAAAMGVEIVDGEEVIDIEALKKDYDYVILVMGASKQGVLKPEAGNIMNALNSLARFRVTEGEVELGRNVVVIGGSNTTMGTARATKRNADVEKVSPAYRRARCYMPADEEGLVTTVENGVEFAELLVPVKLENGVLYCKRMVLGDTDASRHQGVVATDETMEVPADITIAAVGEKVPGAFYESFGIALDSRRRPQVNQGTPETSVKNVYVAGDGLYGLATAVEGIKDGKMVTEVIIGKAPAENLLKLSGAETIYGRKGGLSEKNDHVVDSACRLSCNSYCGNYVEVCLDRASISLVVPGMEKHQIIHADHMCDKCGNCRSFCSWDSVPYLDKFTLFVNEADMENNKGQGFTVLDAAAGVCKVRLQGRIMDYMVGTVNADVPGGIQDIIRTVINDYSYMPQVVCGDSSHRISELL